MRCSPCLLVHLRTSFQRGCYFKIAPWKSRSVPCACASAMRAGSSPVCQNGSCSIWFLSRANWQSHREPSLVSGKGGERWLCCGGKKLVPLQCGVRRHTVPRITVRITECTCSGVSGPCRKTQPSVSPCGVTLNWRTIFRFGNCSGITGDPAVITLRNLCRLCTSLSSVVKFQIWKWLEVWK